MEAGRSLVSSPPQFPPRTIRNCSSSYSSGLLTQYFSFFLFFSFLGLCEVILRSYVMLK